MRASVVDASGSEGMESQDGKLESEVRVLECASSMEL
jgi:hypothetical protein